MHIIIFLLFFNSINCFIPNPIKIILSQKNSIIENFQLMQKEYNHFIYFIHEFHHILGSQIFLNNNNIYNNYIIVPNTIYPKIFSLQAKSVNIKYYEKNKINLILLKIKTKLSGYAAEESFKKKSILLQYFIKDPLGINTKSIFTLLISNFFLNHIITDINLLLIYDKKINYNTPIIKKYLQKYYKKTIIDTNILETEKIVKKLYPDLSNNFLKIIYIIYDELIIEYSDACHQEKIYSMIIKNPSLLAHEIFFFKDLKSLWEYQELSRDIGNINTFNQEEKKIIDSLLNKQIHPFEDIKELKKIHKYIFQINIFSNKISYYQKLIKQKMKRLCLLK